MYSKTNLIVTASTDAVIATAVFLVSLQDSAPFVTSPPDRLDQSRNVRKCTVPFNSIRVDPPDGSS